MSHREPDRPHLWVRARISSYFGVSKSTPRTASAKREEGAYGQYSTDEQRRQTGWIVGRKWEVILARTL